MVCTIVEKDTVFAKLVQYSKCVAKDNTKEYKPKLAKVLDSIYVLDQSTRSMSDLALKNIVDAKKSQITSQLLPDSVYAIYGWLSESEVGSKASLCQFLVIQHSDLQTLQKWVPAVQKAVSNCQLRILFVLQEIMPVRIIRNLLLKPGIQYGFKKVNIA
jgi:hypothetical protein